MTVIPFPEGPKPNNRSVGAESLEKFKRHFENEDMVFRKHTSELHEKASALGKVWSDIAKDEAYRPNLRNEIKKIHVAVSGEKDILKKIEQAYSEIDQLFLNFSAYLNLWQTQWQVIKAELEFDPEYHAEALNKLSEYEKFISRLHKFKGHHVPEANLTETLHSLAANLEISIPNNCSD